MRSKRLKKRSKNYGSRTRSEHMYIENCSQRKKNSFTELGESNTIFFPLFGSNYTIYWTQNIKHTHTAAAAAATAIREHVYTMFNILTEKKKN